MLAIVAIFEYIVWLLPIEFVVIGRYKITKENGKRGGFLNIIVSLILTGVAVSLKEFFIFNSIFSLEKNFLAGNILILISYTFLFMGIKQIEGEVKELVKMPKRMVLYSFLLFLLPIYAAFKKDYVVSADLIIYALLIIITNTSVGKLYFLAKERRKTLTTFISLFSISLLFDFFLKGFSEILDVSSIQSLKMAAFSFRMITSFFLFFIFARAELVSIKSGTISGLHAIAARFVRDVILISLLGTMVFSTLAYAEAQNVHTTVIQNLTRHAYEQLSIDTANTGKELADRITDIRKNLSILSENEDIINISQKTEKLLETFYLTYKEKISSVTRMDKNGVIVFTYPYTQVSGTDIFSQPLVKTLLKTYKEVLSDPITSVQGFPAIIFHEPVFKEGTFNGSIAVLFNLQSSALEKAIISGRFPEERIIIADSYGTIIAAQERSLLMTNIKALISNTNSPGTFVDSAFGRILLARTDIRIFQDKFYIIFAIVPEDIVLTDLWKEVFNNIFLIPIFIISALLLAKMLLSSYKLQSEELKTMAVQEYTKAKVLSNKLSHIVEFFGSTDIDQDVNQFYNRLLTYALMLIENGEAGSVIVKEGDKFVFKAARGFDIEKLGRPYLTKEEMMSTIEKRPAVIKNIYNIVKNYTGKEPQDLKKIDTDKIKSTIRVPFIINGEYYGGLFIDSFSSEDAFSETDLEVAAAISSLGSVFIRNEILIDSVKEAEAKSMFIISEFSNIDISMKEEEFFDNILKIGKYLVPKASGGSITLKQGEYFRYMASFGYKKDVLMNIAFKKNESYIIKTASVVRDIVSYDEALPESVKDALFKAGTDKIKQTLIAPIIVNDEYFGGIYLDSFKEGEIFLNEDLRVATALSNLSSVFVASRFAYDKLFTLSNFNTASVSLFHKVNVNTKKEDIVKISYEILCNLYPAEIEEVAIGEKKKENIFLIKYNGKEIQVYTVMEKAKSINHAVKEKRSVLIESPVQYEKISLEQKGKSQLVIYSDIVDVPVFRIRFNKARTFDSDEKEFFERLGRETANLYQMVISFKRAKELLLGYILSVANAIDSKDPYTKGHSERVSYLSVYLAEKMGLSNEVRQTILIAALPHDVGKIGIPDKIISKRGKLTKKEYEVIKQHPGKGEQIVSPVLGPEAGKIIRHHHERWDGKGYPDGIKDEEIPLCSRIIAIADVFDALTSDRPYRKAYTVEEAIKIIEEGKGTQFDPEIVELFLSIPKESIVEAIQNPDIASIREKYMS